MAFRSEIRKVCVVGSGLIGSGWAARCLANGLEVVATDPGPGAEATLPWLDEQANLRKEKNFFETRVTEYQTGGALKWD